MMMKRGAGERIRRGRHISEGVLAGDVETYRPIARRGEGGFLRGGGNGELGV